MKQLFTFLFLFSCFYYLSNCTVNRYYYVAEEPIALFQTTSYSRTQPILTAAAGDTLTATGTKTIGIGGSIPVEYRNYRFYSPSVRARFLKVVKINPKKSVVKSGLRYEPILPVVSSSTTPIYIESDETRTNTPTTGATIHTGPRGGRYYINSNGNKTYVPRSGSSSPSHRSSGSRGRH